jgi:hypothetical protein
LATFADDTAIHSAIQDPVIASADLQKHTNLLQKWFLKWRMKIHNDKLVQITPTTRRINCPQVTINNSIIPTKTEVKYLGLRLDQKLTWKTLHKNRQQLTLKARQISWLIGKRSQMSLENKVLIYSQTHLDLRH